MSYQAIVAKIETRELVGSDNIQMGTVQGYQVIVDKSVQSGSLGLMFESGGKLSEKMCEANDLIARKDEFGNHVKGSGFFDEKRKVSALKLRGARSEGFFCPLEYLSWTDADLSKLKEGDKFDTLNGHLICEKYYTPQTLRAMKKPGLQDSQIQYHV